MKSNSKLTLITGISFLPFLTAFDNGGAGWKMDGDHIVLKDGNPVYLDNSGREMVVENTTIKRLNDEARDKRTALEAAEKKLKDFDGIDPVKAKEALEAVKNIDLKKLVDSGKVDEVRNQITQEFTAKMKEKDDALASANDKINNMLVSNIFNSSEFVRDGIAVPRDMFEASFRQNFKVEDGKVVAYDKAGNRLMSKQRVGEYADAEEALQLLVEAHPQKDVIMKANTGSGSGNDGGGGNRGTGRAIKRADFEKLPPAKQAETALKVRAGEMQLTD